MEALGEEFCPSLMRRIALLITCSKDGVLFLSVAPHGDVGSRNDCVGGLRDKDGECDGGDLHLP